MQNYRKKGFSLLEVLVVLTILGFFIAMMAQVFTKQDDQRRFDETRIRMEEIKKAILGSKGAYANGQRQFAGYVVDMGELPLLDDALDDGVVTNQPEGLWTDDLDSGPNPDLPAWGYQAISRIWMGWRGPYIEKPVLRPGEVSGQEKLRDGWGNPFHFSVASGAITIESYGADGVAGGTEFSKDISLVIKKTEYMAPIAGRVDGGVTNIKIYYPIAGVENSCIFPTPPLVLTDGDYFRFELTAPAPANIDIPVGLRSIAISKDGGVSWSTDYIFTVEPTGNWLGTLE